MPKQKQTIDPEELYEAEPEFTYDLTEARHLLRLASQGPYSYFVHHHHWDEAASKAMVSLLDQTVRLFHGYSRDSAEYPVPGTEDREWRFINEGVDEHPNEVLIVQAWGDCTLTGLLTKVKWGTEIEPEKRKKVHGPRLVFDRDLGLVFGLDGRPGIVVVTEWVVRTFGVPISEEDVETMYGAGSETGEPG